MFMEGNLKERERGIDENCAQDSHEVERKMQEQYTSPDYRHMFEESPIPMFIEDITAQYKKLRELHSIHQKKLPTYLRNNPDVLLEIYNLKAVIEMNNAAVSLYEAESREQLFQQYNTVFDRNPEVLLQISLAILAGLHNYEAEITNYTLRGNKLSVRLKWSVHELTEVNTKHLIISIQDLTDIKKMQNELIESEQKFRHIFEKSANGIALIDESQRIVNMNSTMEEMLGLNREDCLGEQFWELQWQFCKQHRDLSMLQKIEDILHEHDTQASDRSDEESFHVTITNFYQKKLKINISWFPIQTHKESLTAIVYRDVTSSERTHKLTQSLYYITKAINATTEIQDFYREVQLALGELIDVKNFYISLVNFNKGLIEFPFSSDEVVDDMSAVELGDDRSITAEVIRTGQSRFFTREDLYKRSQNDLLTGEMSMIWMGVPLRIDNQVIGCLALQSYHNPHLYTQDDLEILESFAEHIAIALRERSIEEKMHELATAVEKSAEAVLIVDKEKIVRYINPSFAQITGLTLQSVAGISLTDYSDKYNYSDFLSQVWDQAISGNIWRGQISQTRRDGKVYHFDILTTPILDTEGKLQTVVASCHDNTDKIEREIHLRQLQKVEAIGTLAGGIAHDFNNVLSSIIGYTELALEDAPANSQLCKNMKEVFNAAQRAKEIVQQLVSFSRKEDIERTRIKPAKVVSEAITLLKAYVAKHISLHEYAESGIRDIMIVPGQLHQIIINLGSNAAYSMREMGGDLWIILRQQQISECSIMLFPELTTGFYLEIEIKDTGAGIEPETLDRIFDPYFTTKPNNEGTGLGLSIVQNIVRSHHGAIRVESHPGHGTNFRIYLPSIVEDNKRDTDIMVV